VVTADFRRRSKTSELRHEREDSSFGIRDGRSGNRGRHCLDSLELRQFRNDPRHRPRRQPTASCVDLVFGAGADSRLNPPLSLPNRRGQDSRYVVNSPFNTLLREQHLGQAVTLFVSTFSTLLAITNPLEVLPVFLKLLEGGLLGNHFLGLCG
jgi:hypothetical protein